MVFAIPEESAINPQTLEMWTWSGDVQDLSLSQLNISSIPTVASNFDRTAHMGKMKVIDGKLFWQIQNVTTDTERFIYEVETTPGNPSPLSLVALAPGSLDSLAPYDFAVAGPVTFGIFMQKDSTDVCDIMSIDPGNGEILLAQEFVDCDNHRSLAGVGLLHEIVDPLPANLFLFGVISQQSGNTSFSLEVSDPDGLTVELPVQIEVIAP